MAFIVEMIGGEGRFLACNGFTWPKILEIGKRYGRQPRGTVPDRLHAARLKCPDPPTDYEPEEFAKDVTTKDAWALSHSL